jgi:pimeloyl-ACP methyl ester carboxylesterase
MNAGEIDRPSWFSAAVAQVGESGEVVVEGAPIRYQAWGPRTDAGLVLVHGGAAHSHWWDHLAPLLAKDRRVVALDLSGHGESGRRETYALATWAAETIAVARDAFADPPVIIGHSMGGMVALAAAARFGTELGGVMTIDTPVLTVTPEEMAARDQLAFGPPRVYGSLEQIIAKFRVIPEQETLPYILAHIAETSVREVPGGWSWKFDPVIFAHTPLSPEELSRFDLPDRRVQARGRPGRRGHGRDDHRPARTGGTVDRHSGGRAPRDARSAARSRHRPAGRSRRLVALHAGRADPWLSSEYWPLTGDRCRPVGGDRGRAVAVPFGALRTGGRGGRPDQDR